MTNSNYYNIKDKTILITGAAGLIGSSLAKEASDLGAKLILTDFNKEKLDKISEELLAKNKEIYTLHINLSSQNAIELLMEKTLARFDRVDSAIYCQYPKSRGFGDSFKDFTEYNLYKDLNLQLGMAILFSRKIMMQFGIQGYGDLIHISSIQGVQSPKFKHYENTTMSSPIEYSAIKSGIISITKWLAKYHKNKNIRVNCISPGGIEDNQIEKFKKKYREDCTNIGILSPADISSAILFLLSPAAKAINGHNLIVDDGWTL